jgi:hypothetical protein
MATAATERLVATESGSGVTEDGREVRWTKGVTRVASDSAIAKRWPDFFGPDGGQYDIEDVTRDPGRKRGEK